MKVRRVMKPDVKVCGHDDALSAAAQIMWENNCGCVPVAGDDGHVVGILTDRDICMAAYTQRRLLCEITVANVMAHNVVSCRAGDDLRTAEALMHDNQVRRLPVVNDQGVLVGIISINDIAREAQRTRGGWQPEVCDAEVGRTLAGICRPHRRPGSA